MGLLSPLDLVTGQQRPHPPGDNAKATIMMIMMMTTRILRLLSGRFKFYIGAHRLHRATPPPLLFEVRPKEME